MHHKIYLCPGSSPPAPVSDTSPLAHTVIVLVAEDRRAPDNTIVYQPEKFYIPNYIYMEFTLQYLE